MWDCAQSLDVPIVGVGGIESGRDVVDFLLAGASAVQLGSVLIDKDAEAFGEIGRELARWMADPDVKGLETLVGAALP